MSLLGNFATLAAGAGIAAVAKEYIEKQGGLQAVIAQFEAKGMGDTVKSWVGNGTNAPISAEQIESALEGNVHIQAIASKLGISPDKLHAQLAQHLPAIINELTPNGKIPAAVAA